VKIAKKLPIVRLDNFVLHLEYFQMAWYCDDESSAGRHIIAYRCYGAEEPLKFVFSTKKRALEELDRLMEAIDVPIIEEDDET